MTFLTIGGFHHSICFAMPTAVRVSNIRYKKQPKNDHTLQVPSIHQGWWDHKSFSFSARLISSLLHLDGYKMQIHMPLSVSSSSSPSSSLPKPPVLSIIRTAVPLHFQFLSRMLHWPLAPACTHSAKRKLWQNLQTPELDWIALRKDTP